MYVSFNMHIFYTNCFILVCFLKYVQAKFSIIEPHCIFAIVSDSRFSLPTSESEHTILYLFYYAGGYRDTQIVMGCLFSFELSMLKEYA